MNQDRVRDVFGRRAAGYVNSPSHADQEVLHRMGAMGGDLKGTKILDVATGTGHTALHLATLCGQVIGLDLTRQMLELARCAGEERGLHNVRWVLGDVQSLPFPDGSFDVVSCRRAPHHFPDLGRGLAEMARVLRPGGSMLIDDRSVPRDPGVGETMNRLDKLHDPSHVREYSADEWGAALARAGLRPEELYEYRRHLPLSTMTWNAEPEDAKEIERLVASLPDVLKERMAVEVAEGVTFMDQYYITIRATK